MGEFESEDFSEESLAFCDCWLGHITQIVIDNSETGGQAILTDLEEAIAASHIDPSAAACK